ncbi:FadR/GntR family transcriptional regulator [Pseudocolwellia sp. AS88]|jgi:DNA-binding FadR family transcriptional regulator|uniref:FadR/GntR family transcriptional regulator n=1 Tax=Pseudocolwellia sp. AS88 TaxID=3063958 RepID=UPI0026EC526C|nr:FadR/GntR family transcriptional regulator [Pseudocolwellia sp. AS88]MDO7085453.1 FadR/GntR family transcriptional regulator [Pseudocolwellia sp. AS88]
MKNRRLFWRIAESIEASIDKGEYTVGSRLPPERELADKFDVSRPTIREAIIALEVREKVQVKTGSGVYVLQSSTTSDTNNNISAFELTQARALIEGEVAALAATCISDEELQNLHQTLVMMENAKKASSIEEADKTFHSIIAGATRNGAMIMSVNNLWALRESTIEIIDDYKNVCGKDSELTLSEHTAIYNALKEKDAAKARLAMHRHFNRLINSLFDTIEAKSLEEVRRKNNEKRGLYSLESLIK